MSIQVIKAMGKTWDPKEFKCAACDKQLGTSQFYEESGKPYCVADYEKLYSRKCSKCLKPITSKTTTAMGKVWHPECFNCEKCGKSLSNVRQAFYEHQGKPYCAEDFRRLL